MGSDEEILVVPRRMLIHKPFRGFTRAGVEDYLLRVREYGVFRPRASAEEDPSFKQIIPYLIVRHRGRLFLVQRSTEGGETRLFGKYSIGVGGIMMFVVVVMALVMTAVGFLRGWVGVVLIRFPL